MSKISVGILIAAVVMILAGALFDVTIWKGGSSVVLLVGLVYSYVVAKRDVERAQATAE